MSELFLQILNMSISASWLALVVLAARLLLKKAPKWVNVLLWGIVAVRLACPFTMESILSLIPSGETIPPDILLDPTPTIQSGIPVINEAVNPIITETFRPVGLSSVNPLQVFTAVAAQVWLLGMMGMALHAVVSYLKLWIRVDTAVKLRTNIYQSEAVASPFVLGFLRPKIYLPFDMEAADMAHVIAHEQAHIRRRDHWWKPLGFALLTLHWFNPLMWLAYILLCRDIELACDEKVIKELGTDQRADYSQALLSCSVNRARIAACPLAFGEVGVKARVKSVLNYKKPAFWVIVIAVILCVTVAVCFLTDPILEKDWGVENIRITTSWKGVIQLRLDYNHIWGGKAVSLLAEDEPEYTADGSVPYDGALGRYRIMISFGDADRTAAFRDKFPVGQVCELENAPEVFGGSIKVKVVCPADHGFVIYAGSDIPFTVEEESSTGEVLFGTWIIPLTKVSLDVPRLAAGVYIPTNCPYMNPLSSNFPINLSQDYRYTVTDNSFVTEHFTAAGTNTVVTPVNWQWKTMDEARKDLTFLEGQAFFDLVLDENCLYQKLEDRLHLLQDENTLYLIHGGPHSHSIERLWCVYILTPESEYTGT